jgi:hypothetical protein
MASAFDVALRASKATDQKVAQPLFGAVKVVFRIHRAQNIVLRNLAVKRTDKASETIFANHCVKIYFIHD